MSSLRHASILSLLTAAACGAPPASGDAPATEGPLSGRFRVREVIPGTVHALPLEEARARIGRTASFLPALETPIVDCDAPTYRRRSVGTATYLRDHRFPALAEARARALGLLEGELVVFTACCGEEETEIASTSTGVVLMQEDGVHFVLAPEGSSAGR
ncbi:MAG TPA: hypothetical protein RMH99_09870 [Sandaracinaceae bacterium LLY-WYZ-13_1]|nr:hypothetical protein [Sandaracinaceae bacterium LLY-WYZ-13_1]